MFEFPKSLLPILGVVLLSLSWRLSADLDIPGADGSDGVFAPSESVVIDLSLAPTASWDSPSSGYGVYDPDKWAVVFKYTSVDIPAGVTVSFLNHDSRAPVVWLVGGDVTIDGALTLNGNDYVATAAAYAEPGPGGYAGGLGYQNTTSPSSGGQGMAGGSQGAVGGSHATAGQNNTYPLYGNPRVLPLVGGSGGGGDVNAVIGGAAGGGALLLAVGGELSVNGYITAKGGLGINSGCCAYYSAGSGSGGAIRLIAEKVTGSGYIHAVGGTVNAGGAGRIRIEARDVYANWDVQPAATVVSPDTSVQLWLPTIAPQVEIISIATVDVPSDPHARYEPGQEDLNIDLQSGDSVIELQTHNVNTSSSETVVQVRITPEYGAPFYVDAHYDSGDDTEATWIATATLPTGYFTVQAHAINPEP